MPFDAPVTRTRVPASTLTGGSYVALPAMEASNGNEFQSVAWVLKGITGSESAGLLRLSGGRLTLVGENGPAFDVPASEVSEVTLPLVLLLGRHEADRRR